MSNLDRMIALAGEVFDAKNDPEQISVSEEDMERLRALHSASMTQESTEDGPIAWILVFPTTHELMERFLRKEISERALLSLTPVGGRFEAVYLCSALVLPEYRGKGIAKRLTLGAIQSIQDEHPIRALFVWPWSKEGEKAAESVAREMRLPLRARVST
jgi:ribosomal protein S18 acetylase RimI-like enzyme